MKPKKPEKQVNMSSDVVPAGTYDTGLDDLSSADLVVPRLRIKHKAGVFEDANTGEQMPELICVILGLVRQRVLFHYDVQDKDVPMCKSPDYQFGYPNLEPPRKETAFPWDRAKLNAADFPPDDDGKVVVPCGSCQLKEWGSHPLGSKPYCAEQHTLPIFYASNKDELLAGNFSPALITVQKTGIPPSKRYLGTFKQKNVGAYTKVTKITLNMQSRGQTDYCVPVFAAIGDTDPNDWADYSEQYAGIRHFLTTARPGQRVGDDDAPQSSPATTTPAATTVATASNVPVVDPDDELPF